MGGCKSSLFGNGAQYIKVNGGDFVAIDGANVHGCRITPNVYTTTEELDTLVKALKDLG